MKVIIMARAVLNPPAEVQESIGKYTEQQRQEFVERGTAHFRKVIGKELDGIADLDVKVILREEDDQAAQIDYWGGMVREPAAEQLQTCRWPVRKFRVCRQIPRRFCRRQRGPFRRTALSPCATPAHSKPANWPVVSNRRTWRSRTIARAKRRACGSSPKSRKIRASSLSLNPLTKSAAVSD